MNLSQIHVLNDAKQPIIVDGTAWSEEFVKHMIAYAWGVKLQRCTTSIEDPEEQKKARATMFNSMVDGIVPTKGAGSVKSADPLADIDHEFLKAAKIKGGKKELDARWRELTRLVILSNLPTGTSQSVVDDKMISQYLQEVIDGSRASEAWKAIKAAKDATTGFGFKLTLPK